MKPVAKYNLYKGISTALTVGTPIATLAACGDLFIHRSETAISAAGVFAILIICLLFKDKIAEKMKMPSAFILSTVVFILIMLLEHIIQPMKYVCIATMAMSGVDELTFKRMYKAIERHLPDIAEDYKHVGFIFAKSDQLEEEANG